MIIGMCFGVFDGFHIGHQNFLKEASKLCDALVVFIFTDDTVHKHKKVKLLNSYYDRVRIIRDAGYKCYPAYDYKGAVKTIEGFKKETFFHKNMTGSEFLLLEGAGQNLFKGYTDPKKVIERTPGVSSTQLRKQAKT